MSQPFHIFGLMMTVYPESQGFQGDDDDEGDGDDEDSEESGNFCHSEPSSPLCKSSDSTDDNKTEDLEEPTPFSQTPGHSYTVKDKQVGLAKHALELEEEDQEPFYKDMGMSGNLSGDECPSSTYLPPGHQGLPAFQKAGTAPSGSHDPFQNSSGQHLGAEAAATLDHCVAHPESGTGAEPHAPHEAYGEDRECPSLQPTHDSLWQENGVLRSENEMLRNLNLMLMSENFALRRAFKELKDSAVSVEEEVVLREEYDALREQYGRLQGENDALRKDNTMARRMLNTFQSNLKRQVCMVASLQDQLRINQAEREREAQEFLSIVQATESRLQLMNQRALDAETNVERLKQKVFVLQGQLERCKQENENLRPEWPGSSESQLRPHQTKPPRAHDGQRWLPQVASASGMLPVVAEVLESTRKILKF